MPNQKKLEDKTKVAAANENNDGECNEWGITIVMDDDHADTSGAGAT